jgi:parallel beta-helix repeat protein
MQLNIVPTDGMIITEDTHFARGMYILPNGIQIAGNVTLDGGGAHIVSMEQQRVAVQVTGQENVVIRDLHLSGFYYGVRADDCADVTVENVMVRNTAEIEGIDTFLYLWKPVHEAYSGAILFNNVKRGAIRRCDVQHQMHGVLLYGCSNITLEDTNASFNSGWGVYLYDTHDSLFQRNQLDFCNRLFRRPEDGSIRVEADAAGIVLVRGSSRNRFLRNSCLCGGDGIFVAGYEHPGVITPCNDNLFEDNDCRLSPNNAIESTFSKGNIFRRNDCSRSNYGFWLGFSWENVLEENIVEFSRWAGIAIEHGHDIIIRKNKIRLTQGDGVRLWTRGGSPVLDYYPDHQVSYNFTVEDNLIESNMVGFAGYTGDKTPDAECHDYIVRGNTFNDNRVGAHFARVQACTVEGNTFTNNVEAALRLKGKPSVTVGANTYADNRADVLEVDA